MAASTGIAQPILSRQVLTGSAGVAQIQRALEKATQTFLQGTPVQYDVAGATGFIIACPAMTSVATAIIAGISTEPGSNLTTSGVAKTLTTGFKPPNQASAVVIPIGAPPNDGSVGLVVASDDNLFVGVFGDSSDNTLAVLSQALIATPAPGYGLFKDPGNSFWYVDNHVVTAAAGACVEIKQLIDPIGTLNGRVLFRIMRAAQQLNA